jgi:hypothetical protein
MESEEWRSPLLQVNEANGRPIYIGRMNEFRAIYERLVADAAECELIGNLAVDRHKRHEFRRRAELYKTDADRLKKMLHQDRHLSGQQKGRPADLAITPNVALGPEVLVCSPNMLSQLSSNTCAEEVHATPSACARQLR